MPTAISTDEFEKEMEFLREQLVGRNDAIRTNNPKKEAECDKKIERSFDRLSTDSVYPPSSIYSDTDRTRAKQFFAKASTAYAKAPRNAKSAILLNFAKAVLKCKSALVALTAITTLALSGITALLVGTTWYVDGFGHFAEGSTLSFSDGGSTTLLDTDGNGILDTVQTVDPSGFVTQGDLGLDDIIDLGVDVAVSVCALM